MAQIMLGFLSILLLSQPWLSAARSLPVLTTTLSSNLSRTVTRTSTPAVTGARCCVLQPDGVGLDFWYTSRLEKVIATVLTQYLQYNNTVLTSTTTISNPNATYKYPETPLIPGQWIYTRTVEVNSTMSSLLTTTVASPTPFVQIGMFKFISGTIDGRSGWCTPKDGEEPPLYMFQNFRTPFAYVEDPPAIRTTNGIEWVTPDSSKFIEHWISETPTITNIIPDARDCTIPEGTGEPTVHVPVTALTSHVSTTLRMTGAAPGVPGATTNIPAPTPPVEPAQPAEPTQPPNLPPAQAPPQAPQGQNPSHSPAETQIQPPAQVPTVPEESQRQPSGQNSGRTNNAPPPAQTPGSVVPNEPQNQPPLPLTPVSSGPGVILPNGQTLFFGSTTTISGHEIAIPINALATPVTNTPQLPSSLVVVVDGTTFPLSSPAEPSVFKDTAPVMSITIRNTVVSFQAPKSSGAPIVIPLGSTTVTLFPGYTTVVGGQTLILSAEPSQTVLQIADATTTHDIIVPTNQVNPISSGKQSPSGTGGKPAQFTGSAGKVTGLSFISSMVITCVLSAIVG